MDLLINLLDPDYLIMRSLIANTICAYENRVSIWDEWFRFRSYISYIREWETERCQSTWIWLITLQFDEYHIKRAFALLRWQWTEFLFMWNGIDTNILNQMKYKRARAWSHTGNAKRIWSRDLSNRTDIFCPMINRCINLIDKLIGLNERCSLLPIVFVLRVPAHIK